MAEKVKRSKKKEKPKSDIMRLFNELSDRIFGEPRIRRMDRLEMERRRRKASEKRDR